MGWPELAMNMRLGQNDQHFQIIFVMYGNFCLLIQTALKVVSRDPITNNPAMVQIMAWHRSGDKPLSGLMMK